MLAAQPKTLALVMPWGTQESSARHCSSGVMSCLHVAASGVAYQLCLCRSDHTHDEKENTIEELVREITALWQTDELRRQKPSALDGVCTLPGHVHVHVHAYVCFDVHVYMHVLLLHVLILHVDVPAIETC